jgi:hypothetical protein
MKTYPAIPRNFFEIKNAYIFDKLDGSNLRFEWTRKRGFHKYGTRKRLFDETDIVFGRAVELFHNTLADDLERIFRAQRWEKATAFAEFYGPNSFAGYHDPRDVHQLTLIDICQYKYGFLNPKDFVKFFGHLDTAQLLDRTNWTRGYIDRVWDGEIEGVSFEGVVAKAGGGNKAIRAKAKTRAWIEKVKARFDTDQADLLINS